MNIGLIPRVVENSNENDQVITLDDWLLTKARTICITGAIDTKTAHQTVNKLFYLADKSDDPITIHFMDCPDDSVSAGMAIYDVMQYIDCEVSTVCMGMCASMGALLLAAGSKGKRYIMPNSEVMIYQSSAGTRGMATDMEISLEHFQRIKQRLPGILAKHTSKSESQIKKDSERDHWLSAEEAVAYGLADEILFGTHTQMFDYSDWDEPVRQVRSDSSSGEALDIAKYLKEKRNQSHAKDEIRFLEHPPFYRPKPSSFPSFEEFLARMDRRANEKGKPAHGYEVQVISCRLNRLAVAKAISKACRISINDALNKLTSLPVTFRFDTMQEAEALEDAILEAHGLAVVQELR